MDITELLDKRYLGDGVYCGHDGHQIWIYASNGEEHTKPVAIEAGVMDALLRYAADLWKPNSAPEGGQVGVP